MPQSSFYAIYLGPWLKPSIHHWEEILVLDQILSYQSVNHIECYIYSFIALWLLLNNYFLQARRGFHQYEDISTGHVNHWELVSVHNSQVDNLWAHFLKEKANILLKLIISHVSLFSPNPICMQLIETVHRSPQRTTIDTTYHSRVALICQPIYHENTIVGRLTSPICFARSQQELYRVPSLTRAHHLTHQRFKFWNLRTSQFSPLMLKVTQIQNSPDAHVSLRGYPQNIYKARIFQTKLVLHHPLICKWFSTIQSIHKTSFTSVKKLQN